MADTTDTANQWYYRRIYPGDRVMVQVLPPQQTITQNVHGRYNIRSEMREDPLEPGQYRRIDDESGFSLMTEPEVGNQNALNYGPQFINFDQEDQANGFLRELGINLEASELDRLQIQRGGLTIRQVYYLYRVSHQEIDSKLIPHGYELRLRNRKGTLVPPNQLFRGPLYQSLSARTNRYVLDSRISGLAWEFAGLYIVASATIDDEPPQEADEDTYLAAKWLDRYANLCSDGDAIGCFEVLTHLVVNKYPPLLSLEFIQVKEFLSYLRIIGQSIRQDMIDDVSEKTSAQVEDIEKFIKTVENGMRLVNEFVEYLQEEQNEGRFGRSLVLGERLPLEEFNGTEICQLFEHFEKFTTNSDKKVLHQKLLQMQNIILIDYPNNNGYPKGDEYEAIGEKLAEIAGVRGSYVVVNASVHLMAYWPSYKLRPGLEEKGITVSRVIDFDYPDDEAEVNSLKIEIKLANGSSVQGTCQSDRYITFLKGGCSQRCRGKTKKGLQCKKSTLRLINNVPFCYRHFEQSMSSPDITNTHRSTSENVAAMEQKFSSVTVDDVQIPD